MNREKKSYPTKGRGPGGLLFILLLCLFLCVGCGGETQESGKQQGAAGNGKKQSEADSPEAFYYVLRETAIPDPDETLRLEGFLEENQTVWEKDLELSGESLRRLIQVRTLEGEDLKLTEDYMQVLDPPYTDWRVYPLDVSQWQDPTGQDFYFYAVSDLCGGEGNVSYCRMTGYSRQEKGGIGCLGQWSPDQGGRILRVLPEEEVPASLTLVPLGEGRFGAWAGWGGPDLFLIEGEEEVRRVKVEGTLYGVLGDPGGRDLCWYGQREDGKGVFFLEGGGPAGWTLPELDVAALKSAWDGGTLYLADRESLWMRESEGEAERLVRFQDRGYTLTGLLGMSALPGQGPLLLAEYEGDRHLLSLERREGAEPEKQTLVLATAGEAGTDRNLMNVIGRFNRESQDWQVEVQEPGPEDYAFYADRIRNQISTGSGPDMATGFLLNGLEDFARGGYLSSLEGLLEEEDSLWPAALENGRVDGVLYGAPYRCTFNGAVYPKALAGDREAFTLPELMEAVRATPAKILSYGLDGTGIVVLFGLRDDGSKVYIDWEAGESHLTEEPFIELLEFAREYADRGEYAWDQTAELLQSGEIALYCDNVWDSSLTRFVFYDACFQGDAAILGYPQAQGNGFYVNADLICVNASSDKIQGCREFLNFLLSGQTQELYIRYSQSSDPGNRGSAVLPVTWEGVERSLARKLAEEDIGSVIEEPCGVQYPAYSMSGELGEKVRFALEHAKSARWRELEIEEMVYEELAPYFEGTRSAQEAAQILDNRVQLYLDENG